MPSHFSGAWLFAIPWTIACQAPLSMGFSRQEHWSGLPFPSPMHESEVAQSCRTLSDPMDCSLPGSSIHGIFQARMLEWGAISFSRWSSRPRDGTPVSRFVGRCFYCLSHREARFKESMLITEMRRALISQFQREFFIPWGGILLAYSDSFSFIFPSWWYQSHVKIYRSNICRP